MRPASVHRWLSACCCASALIVATAAASQAPAAQRPDATTKPDQAVRTIVGCLVDELPPLTGNERRSAAGASNAKGFFVRTPTVKVPVGTSVAVGVPGTTSTATSAGSPAPDSFYRVTGLAEAQLKPHVGHRVEVQGHLTPTGSEGTVTSATTKPNPEGGGTTSVDARLEVAGVLHATTIKMVSASCK